VADLKRSAKDMSVDDIRKLVDDESLPLLEVTRRLASWKNEPLDLRLTDWTFVDFRPRDEYFNIHWHVSGRAHALRVFIQDDRRLSAEKKAALFEIGVRHIRPALRVSTIVESGAASTGLFLDLLDYTEEEPNQPPQTTPGSCAPLRV
jgi:hypothetical protein